VHEIIHIVSDFSQTGTEIQPVSEKSSRSTRHFQKQISSCWKKFFAQAYKLVWEEHQPTFPTYLKPLEIVIFCKLLFVSIANIVSRTVLHLRHLARGDAFTYKS